MAYSGRIQGDYTGPTGNPATANATAMYQAGYLGLPFDFGGVTYVWVQLSATASTAVAGQLLYWKTRSSFTVSNKLTEAVSSGGRNWVCGVMPSVVTAGNFFCMIIAGIGVTVASDGTGAIGDMIAAHSVATQATAITAANATYVAASALWAFGTIRTAPVSNLLTADISFLHIP